MSFRTWCVPPPCARRNQWELHRTRTSRFGHSCWRCGRGTPNGSPIIHVYCPGFGTGVGGMARERAARQMRGAWDQVAEPGSLPSLERAVNDEARWRG